MKYSVMYCSKTGNTKLLADAIVDTLKDDELVYIGIPSVQGIQADVIFLGSWTDKGSFDASILDQTHLFENTSVVLFGTAGFGGSSQYFQAIIERLKEKLPASCRVLGYYMCQGKMPLGVRKRYEAMLEKKPKDDKVQGFIDNFDQAFTHPDDADIAHMKEFVKDCIHTL